MHGIEVDHVRVFVLWALWQYYYVLDATELCTAIVVFQMSPEYTVCQKIWDESAAKDVDKSRKWICFDVDL